MDEQFRTWRDAASTGGLPVPAQQRWQPMRAGLVNLWEFEAAEYWFADGRAQFVGANQSGKSTLMALTTLILLTGDLSRHHIDTFGGSEKSFRYYLEPTAGTNDRREGDKTTNQGWAWVEYGRLGADGPRYFTTLLFAQTKRGQNTLTRTWATCEGDARVRAGLDLTSAQKVTTPADLRDVDGFVAASGGTDYAATVSSALFGFDSSDRLATVTRVLSVLRTPHLGQKLDPESFTGYMRQALPALDKREVDELAEGWDQLDKLAHERDAANNARDAVVHYERTAWRPWVDAVLRRAADDVVSAATGLDKITRTVRTATDGKDAATQRLAELDAMQTSLRDARRHDEIRYDEHIRSQSYRDAVDATANAQRLLDQADREAREAADRVAEADRAEGSAATAESSLAALEQEFRDRIKRRKEAVGVATSDALAAGLAPESGQWADTDDTERLGVAINQRHGHLQRTRELLESARSAIAAEETQSRLLGEAESDEQKRHAELDGSRLVLDDALQQISDDLEHWATTVGESAPTTALRESWLSTLSTEVAADHPRQVLSSLITRDWFETAAAPLSATATLARERAEKLRTEATDLDAQAQQRLLERDPEPTPPAQWTRRHRPAPSQAGAPLWQVLDPHPDTSAEDLATVEACLAAAGLLDSWVSPDGLWRYDRDGDETVVLGDLLAPGRSTAASAAQATGGERLSRLLIPAGDDASDNAALRRTAARVIDAFELVQAGAELTGPIAISLDGRWRTPISAGRAAPAENGATLIGTAARSTERERQVALLHAKAADARERAEQHDTEATGAESALEKLQLVRDAAPDDAALVAAASATRTAATEHDRAVAVRSGHKAAHDTASTAAADANTALIDYAAQYKLASDRLDQTSDALRTATDAVNKLATAIRELSSALRAREAGRNQADTLRAHADSRRDAAHSARLRAETAASRAQTAQAALGADEQDLLAREKELKEAKANTESALETNADILQEQTGVLARAQAALEQAATRRDDAEAVRESAVTRWWAPIDARLADAAALDTSGNRTTTQALAQAQTVRRSIQPDGWPDSDDERGRRVELALGKATGGALVSLRSVLEANGGRTANLVEADESRPFPQILILLDTIGEQVDIPASIRGLAEQTDRLAALHDEKMQVVLHELLKSTFIEHLRDRLLVVAALLKSVNTVLAAHPTGADHTTIRLRRVAADGQASGHKVIESLEHGFVDSPHVQEQVRVFLERQIRQAQDAAADSGEDWTKHLTELLDYRDWFDVVADTRIGANGEYRPLTRRSHGVDSGGGKVLTLLQPLLATLVALYEESELAPRPVWLDEAFEGVDLANRSAMLSLFVEFKLDFLLAGPAALVNSAQVPAAALWFVSRAPAPTAGVDLSAMLWAGNTIEQVALGSSVWQ